MTGQGPTGPPLFKLEVVQVCLIHLVILDIFEAEHEFFCGEKNKEISKSNTIDNKFENFSKIIDREEQGLIFIEFSLNFYLIFIEFSLNFH